MNAREIRRATHLLDDLADRFSTILYDPNRYGKCRQVALTAHWADGSGQRIFYSIDEVEDHVEEVQERLADAAQEYEE